MCIGWPLGHLVHFSRSLPPPTTPPLSPLISYFNIYTLVISMFYITDPFPLTLYLWHDFRNSKGMEIELKTYLSTK